jgi:streptogramin lyase
MRRLGLTVFMLVAVALCGAPGALAAAGVVTDYPIPALTTPYKVVTGPDAKLWFVDSGNHNGDQVVGRMATDGTSSAATDLLTLPQSGLGMALTVGPDGNMWVLQDHGAGLGHVNKVPIGATQASQITSYPFNGQTGGYGSITTGPDGRLWFGLKDQVGAMALDGTVSYYSAALNGFGATVAGVISGPGGMVWFAGDNQIERMSTSGVIGPGDVFPIPGAGGISDLAVGPDGNVWFTEFSPAAIGRVTPAGGVTIFPTPTAGSQPFGIAAGPDGRMWFGERNGDNIGVIPTTATSGADIVEYPVGHDNTGIESITAGPDNRMWFNEFNRSALGAITLDTPPTTPGDGGGTPPPPASTPPATTPPAVTPVAVTPVSAASLAALPAIPSAVGCTPNRLILTDVYPSGGKTRLLGVAPPAAIGKQITITSTWNKKTVATAKVGGDGSFSASATLPPASLRASNRARYAAHLGATTSSALKFARRLYTTAVTASGRTITFKGFATRPLATPLAPITIRASAACSTLASGPIVATVTPSKSGTFTASVTLPTDLQTAASVYFRAETKVRKSTKNKKIYPTYTLVRGIKVGAA